MAESADSDATQRPPDGDGPEPIPHGHGSGGALSHGLRGPVDVILSAAQALWQARLPAAHHGLPGAIRRSAGEMLTVVNDLLDAAALSAGDIELIREEFNLRDCISDTLASQGANARRKGFALGGRVASDVPNILFGDPGRLRQVASCLLDNAVRFTERGRIALDVRTESQSRGQAVLHFRVSDTGVGIAPETQGRVFAPLHAGGGDGGGGCLAVAAQVVKRMGGRIWADSDVGRGSRFHFTARFALTGGPVAKLPAVAPDELTGHRAVVVNDNPAEQAELRRLLESWGIECLSVSRGWRGLAEADHAAADGRGPRLALIDANVPDIDAFALARQFADRPALRQTAVVLLAAAGLRGDAARAVQARAAAYLSKPVARDELRQALCASVAAPPKPHRLITRHSLREDREYLLVLLATDRTVDRELAEPALAGWGHKVVCAANGREALQTLGSGRFDVAVMDVDLPAPGGLAVAAEVRRRERATGGHLPMLAITPHDSDQDKTRCSDAGMDACVPRPMGAERLLEAVHAAAGTTPAGLVPRASEPGPPVPIQAATLFDQARAMEVAGGSPEAMDRDLQAFLRNHPLLLGELGRAIRNGDAPAAWRAAHILRTSLAAFATENVVGPVRALEECADRGDIKKAGEALPAVEGAMSRLAEALTSAMEEHEACRY